MTITANLFTSDYARYEGVRPINIYLLRLMYFLMVAFVATDSWMTLIRHEGPWDNYRALAYCVWAAYPTLALLGLMHPLKMLPLMMFTILYKSVWLMVVAYPLWRANALWGSPAEPMTKAFLWLPLAIVAVPWGYVARNYIMMRRTESVVQQPSDHRATRSAQRPPL